MLKTTKSYLARLFRGRFPGLYSTIDHPLEVPVQAAAYRLAADKYLRPGDRVLDVGFGLGYGLSLMAGTAAALTGIDIDRRAVAQGQALPAKEPKIREIRRYDGRRIPYPDRAFDAVTCIDVLEHVPEYQTFLGELLRVSGRVVLVSTPNRRPENTRPDGRPTNYWHLREWSPEELAVILERSGAAWEWNFINGPLDGPFTYSAEAKADTQALTPALFCASSFK